jgi:glycosyltransferase involved in cell wall biosynthesis
MTRTNRFGIATSIVIPAHNEEAVIARTLDSILRDARAGEFAIYVVCNGCEDATAEIAEGYPDVHVIELAVASKSSALNTGDQCAGDIFPRIYLDADVTITTDSLRRVVDVLDVPEPRAAAPKLIVRTQARPPVVRGFYHTFVRLPWVTQNMVGSGFYGLSRAGRERFSTFPELINDDQMVRTLFTDKERQAVPYATFTIEAPHSTRALIMAKARVITGVTEMAEVQQAAAPEAKKKRGGSIPFLVLMRDPRNWLPLCSYALVRVSARAIMYSRRLRGAALDWGQDRTTRAAR